MFLIFFISYIDIVGLKRIAPSGDFWLHFILSEEVWVLISFCILQSFCVNLPDFGFFIHGNFMVFWLIKGGFGVASLYEFGVTVYFLY